MHNDSFAHSLIRLPATHQKDPPARLTRPHATDGSEKNAAPALPAAAGGADGGGVGNDGLQWLWQWLWLYVVLAMMMHHIQTGCRTQTTVAAVALTSSSNDDEAVAILLLATD